MKIKKTLLFIDGWADYVIWSIAVIGMFGSLYFSEIAKMAPCNLCWWQRIFLYPLVAIYAVAILRKDKISAAYYSLPLVVLGLVFSFYQSLLQWGILKETSLTCSVASSVPCGDANFKWFGFITIPFLAFLAFLLLNVLITLRIYIIKTSSNK
jgi:disulfide bond formation protein DsbB